MSIKVVTSEVFMASEPAGINMSGQPLRDTLSCISQNESIAVVDVDGTNVVDIMADEDIEDLALALIVIRILKKDFSF